MKVDDNRSRDQGHFGFGLVICAKVIDWHLGNISVAHSKSLGVAAFIIKLPQKTQEKFLHSWPYRTF